MELLTADTKRYTSLQNEAVGVNGLKIILIVLINEYGKNRMGYE